MGGADSVDVRSATRQRKGVKLSLRWRIVSALLAVSLLPLVLLGIGSMVVFGGTLEDKAIELQQEMVQGHARAIDLYLGESLRTLDAVVRTHSYEDLTDPVVLQSLFGALAESHDRAFVDLGVIRDDGQHAAYVGPYDLMGRNYSSAEWFRDVMAEGSYVSDVFLGFREVPHFIIAIKRQDQSRSWILRATINSEQFDSIVRTSSLGTTGDAFIVNSEGRYQTPPRAGAILEGSAITPLFHQQSAMASRVIVDGEPMVRVTTWINSGRWMLVVQQAEAEIRAPVNQAMFWGAVPALLAVSLIVVTTILATFLLTSQIASAQDQRDRLQQDLLRSAKLASLGEMSTGLAHEINNPLAIISAAQTNISDVVHEAMVDDSPARAEILESVQRSKRQVGRCRNITLKMLQFGRQKESNLQLTDIQPRLAEIVELMRQQASVRNVELDLEVQPDLPLLVLDPTELEQVIVNLITNSLAAIEKSGEIRISAQRADGEVEISVQDSGAGISQENLDRIFQPFFTTKPVGQGTGLGLSVCYGIVNHWGGTIRVESREGHGATMRIRMPIPKESGRSAGSEPSNPQRRGTQPPHLGSQDKRKVTA